jgi:hypothetical protein
VIDKLIPAGPKPPPQVIIEQYPQLPPKPRDIIIERWLPIAPRQRRILYERLPQTNRPTGRPIIVQYGQPQIRIQREVIANSGTQLPYPQVTGHRDVHQLVNQVGLQRSASSVVRQQTSIITAAIAQRVCLSILVALPIASKCSYRTKSASEQYPRLVVWCE